jgi:1,4-dihydroxy-2-naphthoate octaprenyltransferase
MKNAVVVFTLLCLISGLILLWSSFGWEWRSLLFFLALGLLSIVAAIAYTVGKKPYGYIGLGDLSVLIFFGMVGVLGSLYLFTHQFVMINILPALSCGFFSMAVLNINNVRDIESDRMAGKYSIPVRIGKWKAAWYHWFLLAAGITCSCLYVINRYQSPWQFLFLLVVPLLIMNGKAVMQKPSSALDPYLRQMALSTLLFVVLFGVGCLSV